MTPKTKKYFRERIKLLSKYNPKFNLKENREMVSEQIPDSRYRPIEEPKKIDPEEYPNYCSYPDKAILPPKNKYGLKGVEAIPYDEKAKISYCYYPCPTPMEYTSEVQGIFIASDSEIRFFDMKILSSNVDFFVKKYGGSEEEYIKNFSTILPIGTVYSFGYEDGEKYTSRVRYKDDIRAWVFLGYFNERNEFYKQPDFIDPRNKYEKFLDNWGFELQFLTAIITIILTKGRVGNSKILWAEILSELGIGTALAVREFQKKQNMAGLFTLLTGFLPMLKLTKWFRGVNSSQMSKLKSKILSSGLELDSKPEDFLRVYRSLDSEPELQKTFAKIFYHDPITKELFEKELKEVLSNSHLAMIDEFTKTIKETPDILKDVSFLNKLWGRELSANVIILILGVIFSSLYDRELTNEEKSKLQMLYSEIPEKHRMEYTKKITRDMDKLKSELGKGTKINPKFFD